MRATTGGADKGGAGGRRAWPYTETVLAVVNASVGLVWFAMWYHDVRRWGLARPTAPRMPIAGAFFFAYGALYFLRAARIARGDSRALRAGRLACGVAMALLGLAHFAVLLAA